MDQLRRKAETIDSEEGHAYAWGGGTIVAVVLIVLLLILIL